MKNKYKGLAEYLVKEDQYLALNLEQARHIVKLVKAFEVSSINEYFKIQYAKGLKVPKKVKL